MKVSKNSRLNIKHTLSLILLLLAWTVQSSQAYVKNTVIAHGGLTLIAPFRETSSTVLDSAKNVVAPGMKISSITPNLQIGFGLTYMPYDSVGFDISASTSFSQKFFIDELELGEVISSQPSFMFYYYPETRIHTFNPYLGVGIRYFGFINTTVSQQFKTKNPGQDWIMEIESQFGWSTVLGFDYWVAQKIAIQASAHYNQQKTNIEMKRSTNPMNVLYAYNTRMDSIIYTLGLTIEL